MFTALDPSLVRDEAIQAIWEFKNLSPGELRGKVGREIHPVWEYYTKLLSNSIKLSIQTEEKSPEGYIPDHIISRDSKFSTQIETKDIFKRLFRGENLQDIIEFFIDYTLSIRDDVILGKCKKYSADGRFLLIVLYGPLYDDGDILNLETIIQEEGYDNVKILTLNEYFDLLGIDNKIIDRANTHLGITNDLEGMINKILTGPLTLDQRQDLLDVLSKIYRRARTLLKFGTTMDNFLGDK